MLVLPSLYYCHLSSFLLDGDFFIGCINNNNGLIHSQHKKEDKSMNKKRLMGLISICLVFTVLGGILASAFTRNASAADPFEQMRDEYLLDPYDAARVKYTGELLEKAERVNASPDKLDGFKKDGRSETVEFAVDPYAGKTDRYIIKYKDNRDARFIEKVSGIVASAEALTPVILPESGVLKIIPDENDVKSNGVASSERSRTKLYSKNTSSTNKQVLILNDKKLPSEFAAELRALGADVDIEYIQPDFELSLDSIGLELIDITAKEAVVSEQNTFDKDKTFSASEQFPNSSASENVITDEENDLEKKDTIKVDANGANVNRGLSNEVIVAVIDTGLDTGHEVFEGYLHDDSPNTPTDSLSYAHGTHIGGIVVNTAKEYDSDVKLLPIKVFDNGSAYTSDIIAAVEYATAMGAQVVNCSFGSTNCNQALFEAIAASSALFVCAVGNNRRDIDIEPSYPAGYNLPNIISVASTNADDGFSYYSNYGINNIDIAARGREVYSAIPGNRYGTQTGTSMSAAYVTAVAAVTLSVEEMDALELKARLLSCADMLSNLENKVNSGRRLSLSNAVLGVDGAYLTLNPTDDFDVHGYQRTDEENWQLFSGHEIIQVAAGVMHSLALASDGTVWEWGTLLWKPGSSEITSVPTQVVGLTSVTAISTMNTHNLALRADGTVWAWGDNSLGQLGDGSTVLFKSSPTQVYGIYDVSEIAAGEMHSMATVSNGAVLTWGCNHERQLGDGTTINRLTPVMSVPAGSAVSIAAGAYYSLALKRLGTLIGWGSNSTWQLEPYGSWDMNPTAISVWKTLATVDGGYGHTLAVADDRTVFIWGNYDWPMEVDGLSDVKSVSAGFDFSLALKEDGTVWSWGDNNYYGQLGNGTTVSRSNPGIINGLENIISVSAGVNHCLAADSSGRVWVWGDNSFGQLGDGSTTGIIALGNSNFSSEAVLELSVVLDHLYIVSIKMEDTDTFIGKTFTLEYNAAELSLIDFATQTSEKNVITGTVSGTPLTILSHSNGVLTFSVDKLLPAGYTWSGIVTLLSFKALQNGTTEISIA